MYRSHRGDRNESEHTHTAGGVDPQTLDHLPGESCSKVRDSVHSTNPQDWAKYYEQADPGTSTDILDTEEARQTTFLIL